MKVYNEPIAENRMSQFHKILIETGGRYLNNPTYFKTLKIYRVNYKPGDYEAQTKAWDMINKDISEVRKGQWYRRLFRRFIS